VVAASKVLSQKAQYAVRAVLELAKRHGSGAVKASVIAEAQYLPVRFLEGILGELRQAGVVESIRGKEGGYFLRVSPGELSVGEIIRLTQGRLCVVDCHLSGAAAEATGRDCALREGCVLLPMWKRAEKAMMSVYDGTSFQELVDEERAVRAVEVLDYAI